MLALVNSFEITGKIDNKNITSLRFEDVKLRLIGNHGFSKLGFVDYTGNFKIYVADPGQYKLEVYHSNFYFEPVLVDVKAESELEGTSKQYTAFLWIMNSGSKGVRLLYPLQLEPSHKIKYFDIEEAFNPLVYLKSPMVLMIGVSLLLMYMMKAVPKEEMEAYQEQQADTLK